MFEAILFLAGAVLFFLAVLFFVFLWQDRVGLARRRQELLLEVQALKEQRVALDIWEHELQVWAAGLDHQQAALEQAQEEIRMLTASKQPPEAIYAADPVSGAPTPSDRSPERPRAEQVVLKNLKQDAKLSS